MGRPNKLAEEETRRIAQQESIKSSVREEVDAEIKRTVDLDAKERAQVESVAQELKHSAIREVSATEAEIERARKFARLAQFIDYFFTEPSSEGRFYCSPV